MRSRGTFSLFPKTDPSDRCRQDPTFVGAVPRFVADEAVGHCEDLQVPLRDRIEWGWQQGCLIFHIAADSRRRNERRITS